MEILEMADRTDRSHPAGEAKQATMNFSLKSSSVEAPDGIFLSAIGMITASVYFGLHAACLLVLWTGVSAADLLLFAATYCIRMFAITGAYHRYFSHRTYKTGRLMQFFLGFLGTSAVQKGPLWWASHHRQHHRYSDQPGDPHSPRVGFMHAHQGWIFEAAWRDTTLKEVRDLAKYPELVWLNQWHIVPPILLAIACYAVGGFSGLVWGFVVSTVACWHVTYSINSLSHRWGTTRFDTGDDSRNNVFLAVLTFGEGWHNNHHRCMNSTRQGFYWWEIDITYYILRGLQFVGLIWDVRTPPESVYAEARENRAMRQAERQMLDDPAPFP